LHDSFLLTIKIVLTVTLMVHTLCHLCVCCL